MHRVHVLLLLSMVWRHALGQNYTISTIAGGGLPVNLPGTSASLNAAGVTVDSAGNVFIASSSENIVLRLDAKTGILTLTAGTGTVGFSGDNGPATEAQLNSPGDVVVDSSGNLYISDSGNYRVRKVSNGLITTVAGNGTGGFSGDNGPATSAQFYGGAIAVDSAGNLYIADLLNGRVRKVSNGVITTVAGNGTPGFSGDNGPATRAQLFQPEGVAVDSAGDLYIADSQNDRIRKVSNGVITTVAGGGTGEIGVNGIPATSARLALPTAVAVDSAGNLYIGDAGTGRILEVSNGLITTVASSTIDNSLTGGLSVDSAGNLYVANGVRISKVSNGVIAIVAGNGASGFSGDNGPATSAQLNLVANSSVAVDSAGNLYITDQANERIRKVSNGLITTVAGNGALIISDLGDNGPATSAELHRPSGVAVDSAGNLYIADEGNDRVREVSRGVIATVAGNGTVGFSGDNGPATSAQLSLIDYAGVAVDSAGNLYISDNFNYRIREVSNGVITTVAGNGTPGFSGDNGPATSAQLRGPAGVAVDSAGSLYFVDGNFIRKVSNGVITTLLGNGTFGSGPTSDFFVAFGIAVDALGNLYFADYGNNVIRKVSNGVITTVAGNGMPGFSGDNGPATSAELNGPGGVAVDSSGRIYFADDLNNRVRVLVPDCTYNVSPSSVQSDSLGGSFPITIQTDSFCLWTIAGLPGWITLSTPSPAAGTAEVSLVIAANTGAVQLTTLLVAGQPITVTQTAAPGFGPAISSVANAAGQSPIIAPNTWVEINGSNLAPARDSRIWQSSDLVNNQMPTQLDGVSVTMNGENAFVDYISANQVNVLTPPDLAPGPVQVVVTVAGGSSPAFTSTAQPDSPSLFVFNGEPYVAAVHANGSMIGPTSLYPGSTTPAKPGETVLLYANGFGPTNVPVTNGSVSQSGTLSPLPVITIGGVKAAVSFAGLVAPGEFQFNVVVPSGLSNGDQSIAATCSGQATQAGTLITIQN